MSEPRVPPLSASRCWALLALLIAALTAARLAALALSPLGLQVDEAQYWIWSRSFAFGYFSKPPLIAWAIGLASGVCGDAPACVRLPTVLAHALGPVFVFLLARNLAAGRTDGGNRTALLAALVYATLPGILFSGLVVSTDALLLPAWAAALWCYERGLATRGLRWFLGLGLALGLGMLAKYAMAYFVLGVAVHLGLERLAAPDRRPVPWRGLALALGLGLLIFAPNLAWNASHAFLSFRHTADAMNLHGSLVHPEALGAFLASQAGVFGPLTLYAALRLAVLRTTWRQPAPRLLLAFGLPLVVLIAGQALLSRANANWAAPAYVSLGVLVAGDWLARGRTALLRLSLGLHGAIGLVLLVSVALGQLPLVPLGPRTDPMKALRGWDVLAAAVAQARSQNPRALVLSDEREMLVELTYALRDQGVAVSKWNGNGRIDDQFDLVADFGRFPGADAILVTRGDDPAVIARHFESAEKLADVATRPYDDPRNTYHLWLMRRFGGY